MQRHAARHQHFEIGADCQESRHICGCVDHLLEVVQEQQEVLPAQGCFQQVKEGLPRDFFDVECLS